MLKYYQVRNTRDVTLWAFDEESFAGKMKDQFLNGGYDLVASVDTDDLDKGWFLTNTINHYWVENPEVTLLDDGQRITEERGGLRSAMVGDIYELDGKLFVVASFGFDEIELD